MTEPKESISRPRELLYGAFALVGLIGGITMVVAAVAPYFQRPEIVYSTKEITAYPMPYQDSRPAPADIQGALLVGGAVRILNLTVQNDGARSVSDVFVRIPLSADDGYVGGWKVRKSDAPATAYMLGAGTEYRFHNLIPGDAVTFCLYLKNVQSDVADRIEVLDGYGRRAMRYQYDPVRYLGSDGVNVTIRRRWIYVFGLTIAAILLLSALRVRDLNLAGMPADEHDDLADVRERLSTSSSGLGARDQPTRDGPSRRQTVGGR